MTLNINTRGLLPSSLSFYRGPVLARFLRDPLTRGISVIGVVMVATA